MLNGARLALSWLTVLPVRGPATVDRAAAARAIALAPLVGALLGGGVAGLLWFQLHVGMRPELAGVLAVAAMALLTRGMHLDGLADTFDGLGCYGPPERARAVMRGGGAGPFGIAAIVICLAAQALSLATLASHGRWWPIVAAVTVSRAAAVLACRRGTPAAPDSRFGELVASTQPWWVAAGWAVLTIAFGTAAGSPHWLPGAFSIVAALAISVVFTRHCVRRFGGLSGDVLGAAIELTLTSTVVLLSLRP